jgi:fermentation-respiration switch protein FrsA (DUF1100 family)
MTVLKWLLVVAAGYGCLVALLYFAQRSMMYFPVRTHLTPRQVGFTEAAEVVLGTADGEKVLAWHVAPRPGKALVIYFPGNAEIMPWRADRYRVLIADGTGLLAVSYRGYSTSTGRPTEEGLHQDALAAYAFAAGRVEPKQIALWGHSLGSGVAVRLASEREVGRLVLEAPFFSAVDVAAKVYPFIPVRLLMLDQFRSDLRIGGVTAPVLIVHGERDTVVPVESGERLFGLIRAPKRFVRYPRGDHVNLDDFGVVDTVHAFLDGGAE